MQYNPANILRRWKSVIKKIVIIALIVAINSCTTMFGSSRVEFIEKENRVWDSLVNKTKHVSTMNMIYKTASNLFQKNSAILQQVKVDKDKIENKSEDIAEILCTNVFHNNITDATSQAFLAEYATFVGSINNSNVDFKYLENSFSAIPNVSMCAMINRNIKTFMHDTLVEYNKNIDNNFTLDSKLLSEYNNHKATMKNEISQIKKEFDKADTRERNINYSLFATEAVSSIAGAAASTSASAAAAASGGVLVIAGGIHIYSAYFTFSGKDSSTLENMITVGNKEIDQIDKHIDELYDEYNNYKYVKFNGNPGPSRVYRDVTLIGKDLNEYINGYEGLVSLKIENARNAVKSNGYKSVYDSFVKNIQPKIDNYSNNYNKLAAQREQDRDKKSKLYKTIYDKSWNSVQ